MNSTTSDHGKLLNQALMAIKQLRQKIEELEAARSEPIAIVGIGCRFAPDIDSPEALWELLARGGNAISEIPVERWDNDFYYDPDTDAPGKICTRYGGFLQHKDLFDPQFFKISPREAAYMDPQQRLLLEVAWEALENADIPPDRVYGSDGGVFVGISSFDYGNLVSEYLPFEEIGPTVGTGIALSPAAGRISYVLGMQGPSICVDTACSSSLVAVQAACESLKKRECSIALAGGVNMILSPLCHVIFSKSHMLSREGRCKTFDESADGFVRSEGAGVLVLKRLKDAQANQDRVLAVIRGGAVNQDGASGGLTVPNGPAQQRVIRQALQNAGLKAEDVDYIEAHGTGTPLGDPIEMNALGEVFRKSHTANRPLWVGSAKTNLGHMESAAGMGGLIKTILQLHKGMIVPHLNFQQPSSRIAWEELPVRVPTALFPWPLQGKKKPIAGVSSFGFSGTNAHLLLEAAPEPEPRQPRERSGHVLTLSAKNEDALRQLALSYSSALKQNPNWSVADVCHSAGAGRAHFSHRAAIIATSISEMKAKLGYLQQGESAESVFCGAIAGDEHAKVAFLFTGQGSQYFGMGRELYEGQPLFRKILEECDEILSRSAGWSLLDILYSNVDHSKVHQTRYSQPLLFSIEYALARLWQSWGIQPAMVIGHSIGEYVAAAIAGVFSLEDGLKLIAARGELMQALPPGGGMMAIRGRLEEVAAIIAPYSSRVSIASIDGPRNIVISGAQDHLLEIAVTCSNKHLSSRQLEVSHAFHSSLMPPILEDFARIAETVKYSTACLTVISDVAGNCAPEALASADYWVRHISAPVHFYDGVRELVKRGCRIMLEIGPRPMLIDLGRECVEEDLQWLASLSPGFSDWGQMLQTLARMYVAGLNIDWEQVNQGYYREKVVLPTYPFQRERYWFAPQAVQKKLARRTDDFHPLLGKQLSTGDAAVNTIVFESDLGRSSAYLMDHRVLGRPLFPAAGYIEVALAVGQTVLNNPAVLRNFVLRRPLLLSEDCANKLRTIVEPGPADTYTFRILSKKQDESDAGFSSDWILHAQGVLSRDSGEPVSVCALDVAQGRIGNSHDIDNYYDNLRQRGLEYGPAFRTIRELRFQGSESVGLIAPPHESDPLAERYIVHPIVLDGAFQVLGTALTGAGEGGAYLHAGFESLRLLKKTSSLQWAHAIRLAPNENERRAIRADMTLYDTDGNPAVIVSGFRIVPITSAALSQILEVDPADFLYQLSWFRRPQLEELGLQVEQPHFLIFADAGGVAERVALQLQETGCNSVLVYAENSKNIRPSGATVSKINPSCLNDFLQVLAEVKQNSYLATLFFWGLDVPTAGEDSEISFEGNQLLGCGPLLNLVNALASRPATSSIPLFVFTRNAFATDSRSKVHVAGAAMTGLARVAGLEYPSLCCTQIDLDADGLEDIEARQIVSELFATDGEEQVALRSGLRFGPRLRYMKGARSSTVAGPIQVTLNGYGAFENLGLETLERRPPEPGEVEVAVRTAAINFKDVLNVLGMLKEHALRNCLEWVDRRTLGFECSGTIVAVGEGVSGKKVGDAVICFGSDCLSSYVTLGSDAVVLKPEGVTFEEAAAIPTSFLTAYHALYALAKVRPGDKILIHAAAGSVGQAAIQLCRRISAEVFATASPPKWDFLKSQGIKHVMNSRNTEFAAQIRELTNGRGVDVVLNSLSGEFIPSSLEVLAPGGHFVEIGKLDIWSPEQVAQARPDVSYFNFDMGEVAQDHLAGFNAVLSQVTAWMEQGSLAALPVDTFPVAEVGAAFRHLAQGKNVGKVVLTFPPLPQPDEERLPIRSDSCYWITEGLGDIGLKVAEWLVAQGARHLVLSGRNRPSEGSPVLTRLQSQGARVEAVTADVSRRDDVRAVLEKIDQSQIPLGGIFHAAGVSNHCMLRDQDWARFQRAMASDVGAVWNLHTLTQERPLDFFVCFSSLAGVLGLRGWGNYAAGNAFTDALMHYRKRNGLPALSIDWGPWASLGASVTTEEIQAQKMADGLHAFPVSLALSLLEHALRLDQSQVIAAAIDWHKLSAQYGANSVPGMLEAFVKPAPASATGEIQEQGTDDILYKLRNAPATERHGIALAQVRRTLASTLRLRSAESVGLNQPLADLGIDSLMAVEVRNLLSSTFRCELPSTLVFDHPTANALTAHLIQRIFPGQPTMVPVTEQPVSTFEFDHVPHAIAQPELKASLQTLIPVWNPVRFETSKRITLPTSTRILLLGNDQTHLDWLRKCYPNTQLVRLVPTSEINDITKALADCSFDQLIWIAPDVTPNRGRETGDDEIIEQQECGVLALFRIIKALLALGYADKKLQWTTSTGRTQQVIANDPVQPVHAGIAGLIGSLAKEYPHWDMRLLDVDSLAAVSAQECLTLPWDKQGNGLAYRQGEWFQQGMARITTFPEAVPVYRQNGVYVVIGGAGGLGEVWSRFMIENYRANIVWIGRREYNAEIESKIDALGELGSAPLYISADATNLSALEAAREMVLTRYPAIHGIVHSAIVLHDQSIGRMDEDGFRAGFSAKLNVSVNMDRVFGNQELDFMLFFSSFISFARSSGQSNYSAGCTFQDSFGHKLRQERAYPVKVMNWGYWGSVGIVADEFHNKSMAQRGIGSIEPEEGMASLAGLVSSELAQMAVIKAANNQTIGGLNLSEAITYYPKTEPAVLPQVQRTLANRPAIQSVSHLELLTPEILDLATELLAASLKSVGLFSNGIHRIADLPLAKLPAPYFERWLSSSLCYLRQQKILSEGFMFMRQIRSLPDLWAEWQTKKSVLLADPNLHAPIALLETCLKALPQLLSGRQRGTDVIFPNSSMKLVDAVYRDNVQVDYFNGVLGEALVSCIEQKLQAGKNRMIRILEIGAGTGGTTAKLLPLLQNFPIEEYCYTDVSKAFLTYAEKHYHPRFPVLSMAVFDVSTPLASQPLAGDHYDVVIAANVLHATPNIRETLRNAKAALKNQGVLLLYEITAWSLFSHLTFGLLEGWWLHEDSALRLPGSPALTPEKWRQILEEEGFESIFFPAEEARKLGQQIIVAASNGWVRQPIEFQDQYLEATANPQDEAVLQLIG